MDSIILYIPNNAGFFLIAQVILQLVGDSSLTLGPHHKWAKHVKLERISPQTRVTKKNGNHHPSHRKTRWIPQGRPNNPSPSLTTSSPPSPRPPQEIHQTSPVVATLVENLEARRICLHLDPLVVSKGSFQRRPPKTLAELNCPFHVFRSISYLKHFVDVFPTIHIYTHPY